MLENKTIISTRPHSSNDQLIVLLQEAGASCISMPMIAIERNELSQMEKDSLLNLEKFDWAIFTSKNGVQFFFEYLDAIRPDKAFPENLRLAVVGNSTKRAVQKYAIEPSLVSTGKTSEDLLNQFKAIIPKGSFPEILLPLGTLAGSILEEGLESMTRINRINVYKTVLPNSIDKQTLQKIKEDQYDLILLASPSAFNNLKECLAPFRVHKLRFACIGPTTEETLKKLGILPEVVAKNSTSEGMYESVKNYFEYNTIKNLKL